VDITASFISVIVLFDEAFYGSGVKCRSYVGTNAEPLCVEFCNCLHCYIFVNYLTC
jgi:hypothetical protein